MSHFRRTPIQGARQCAPRGKPAECERLTRTALLGDDKVRPDSWQRHFTACLLGACLAATGQPAEAGRLLRAGVPAVEARRALIPVPERDRIGEARGWLAESEKRAGAR